MRLLIADSDNAYRGRLRPLLKRVSGVRGLEEFDTFQDLKAAIGSGTGERVCIVSETLRGMPRDGVAQITELCGGDPVIILGADDPERLRAVFRDGVHGYVRRTQVSEELTSAIAVVVDGGIYIPPLLGLRPSAEPLMTSAGPVPAGFFREEGVHSLTPRQREVLSMIRSDWTNKQIADSLGVTTGTVKIHITAIFKALGARNRQQARIFAETVGIPYIKPQD